MPKKVHIIRSGNGNDLLNLKVGDIFIEVSYQIAPEEKIESAIEYTITFHYFNKISKSLIVNTVSNVKKDGVFITKTFMLGV